MLCIGDGGGGDWPKDEVSAILPVITSYSIHYTKLYELLEFLALFLQALLPFLDRIDQVAPPVLGDLPSPIDA